MRKFPAALASLTRVSLFTLAVTLSVPASAQEENSNLVFVLDGSGSMWGRVDGEMKIVEAKQVMADLLADVPENVDVGLVSYGHRRKGDCSDIETLASLGTSPATVATQIQGVSPKGKTPITTSLEQAAELLSGKEGSSTLVLVSDGLETCQGDPCALAKQLGSQGIDLVIHTVGFGVGGDAAAQLQCVAQAGGGNYYHAANGAALRESLFAVREAVAKAEPPPPPPEALALPEVETKTTRVTIAGPGTIILDPAPWVTMPPDRWLVLDAETGEKIGESDGDRLRIKSGEYQLAWKQAKYEGYPVSLTEAVTVAAGKTVTVPVDTGLRISIPEGMKGPFIWSLRTLDAAVQSKLQDRTMDVARGDVAFFDSLDPQVVPAGKFRLLWKETKYSASIIDLGLVEVLPGQLNEHVRDGGFVLQGADWVPGTPYAFQLVDKDGRAHAGWIGSDEQVGWRARLAPPGEYELQYKHTQYAHDVTRWGPITINEHGMTHVTIDSGVQFVPEGDVPVPYMVTFTDLDSNEDIGWKAIEFGRWDAVPLPPGRYRIDWQEQQWESERLTVLDELEVPAGTLVEIGI